MSTSAPFLLAIPQNWHPTVKVQHSQLAATERLIHTRNLSNPLSKPPKLNSRQGRVLSPSCIYVEPSLPKNIPENQQQHPASLPLTWFFLRVFGHQPFPNAISGVTKISAFIESCFIPVRQQFQGYSKCSCPLQIKPIRKLHDLRTLCSIYCFHPSVLPAIVLTNASEMSVMCQFSWVAALTFS